MACLNDSSNESYFKSLERIQNYPIVNDSVVTVYNYYHWFKSKSSIIDNTLSRAENTVKTIKDTTKPIVGKKLAFIDDAVYNQLELLERTCPIILQPSSEITNIPSRVYHDAFQPTFNTIMMPIFKTINTFSASSTIVKSAMTSVVGSSIDGTNYLLDKTDQLLDKYLPDEDHLNDKQSTSEPNIYSKVKRLSGKTQNRLYKRAINQFNVMLKSSIDILEHIQSVIVDIQLRKQSFQSTLCQGYSKSLEIIKDNLPTISSKYSNFIIQTRHHLHDLQQLIVTSATSTFEHLLFTALDGITSLNSNLSHLQDFLTASRPEFISENIINNTNEVFNEIRIGIESFVHNMRDILTRKIHDEEMIEMTEMGEN